MRLFIDDACKKGNVDQAINLIKQGYKLNDPYEEGFTPFIYITFAAQVDACDALIASQADINVQNGYDWNITHVCSLIDKDREGLFCDALIASQADINVQNVYDWNITRVCSLIDKDREGLLLE